MMAYPGTKHALWIEADQREREKSIKRRKSGKILPRAAREAVIRMVIPYIDQALAEAVFKSHLKKMGYSATLIRSSDKAPATVKMRFKVASYLRSQGIKTGVIGELMNRDYDTIRYYIHAHHRATRKARYHRKKAFAAEMRAD